MTILVTGGAGYIGSHTCIELMKAGYEIIVADNLYNSCEEALRRVEQISGKKVPFVNVDLCDGEAVDALFASHPEIDAVIHFAAYKAVGESVQKPLEYYTNNLGCTLTVLNAMRKYNVKNFVFSSSATVYGDPASVPITEDFPTGATTNPYGTTKVMMEQILKDYCKADPTMNVALLRYFNPIGAHESGLIGEDPNGIPNNLMPFVCQTAAGIRKELQVFGDDYDTPDGTGVRDYIHVTDLISGHIAALKKLETKPGCIIHNLGTGNGTSVLEMVHRFEAVNGVSVPYRIVARRPGDVASCYADPSKAFEELGWKAVKTLDDMVRDSWMWQLKGAKN